MWKVLSLFLSPLTSNSSASKMRILSVQGNFSFDHWKYHNLEFIDFNKLWWMELSIWMIIFYWRNKTLSYHDCFYKFMKIDTNSKLFSVIIFSIMSFLPFVMNSTNGSIIYAKCLFYWLRILLSLHLKFTSYWLKWTCKIARSPFISNTFTQEMPESKMNLISLCSLNDKCSSLHDSMSPKIQAAKRSLIS